MRTDCGWRGMMISLLEAARRSHSTEPSPSLCVNISVYLTTKVRLNMEIAMGSMEVRCDLIQSASHTSIIEPSIQFPSKMPNSTTIHPSTEAHSNCIIPIPSPRGQPLPATFSTRSAGYPIELFCLRIEFRLHASATNFPTTADQVSWPGNEPLMLSAGDFLQGW